MRGLIANALNSWKTTLLGSVPGAVVMWTQIENLLDKDPATQFGVSAFLGGLALTLGFFFAKDANVTGRIKS